MGCREKGKKREKEGGGREIDREREGR